MNNIKKLFDKKWLLDKDRGRNFILYLVFIFVSLIFWLLLTLNNEVQKDLFVNVNIKSIPDSTTIINEIPKSIRVVLKDKGSSLLKYNLGQNPILNLSFTEYSKNGVFRITEVELKSVMRDVFGSNVNIIDVDPDSIHIRYTNLPGKKVPIVIDANANANLQYVINGKIKGSEDSAIIFSDKVTLSKIHEVFTQKIEETELKDTLHKDVQIRQIKNVKIVPEAMKVVVPVEPLIMKHISIPIIARNVPEKYNLVTFPSSVQLSFLVPLSRYKDTEDISAIVFYDESIELGKDKLKLNLTEMPAIYKSPSLSFNEVEYIVERKN